MPILACELDASDCFSKTSEHSYTLLSPTGLNIRKFWMVGTLTAYNASKRGGNIRIADPTGVLTIFLKNHLNGMNVDPSDLIPPLFLSITAFVEKTSEPEDNPVKWILETSQIVTRQERDKWLVAASDELIQRLEVMNDIFLSGKKDDSLRSLKTHDNFSQGHLKVLAEQVKKALAIIKEPGPAVEPSVLILSIIKEYSGPKGVNIDDIYRYTRRAGVTDDIVKDTIRTLVSEDEVYQPSPGYIKIL